MPDKVTWSDAEVLCAYPTAAIDQDNVAHYRGRLLRKLLVNCCCECGWWHEPPRPVCARCWSDRVEAREVSGRGVIALLTVLRVGPPVPGVDYGAGYPLAAVELVEQTGLRFTAGVVGPASAMRIGTTVELTWTEGVGNVTPAFLPIDVES
ncbi:hypothetical protein CIW51_30280 [Mycolicibacterium sp. P9-22]|nr:OB-fold domain-containing protein [Mycolicibacterium sp. P9-22]KAA0109975.1 hypothetical protein CIW51_30280 [Mycolicibacterium sp. P9-22]